MKRRSVPRPSASLLVSLAVHAVLGAGLVSLLSLPFPFEELLRRKPERAPTERISFFAIPDRGGNSAGRSGGDRRPVRARKPPPLLVAPGATQAPLPPPPAARRPVEPEGGTGAVVGKGGATEGVVPSFSDPRLWLPPGTVVSAPLSPSERLDSSLTARIRAHLDSVQALASGQKPADWTLTHGDKKYGLDQHNIYLGSVKIPAALLALLPLNVQSNPIAHDRERSLGAQHAEIVEQAQRAANDDDFKSAVKRIRERKWRKREERLAEERKQKDLARTPETP